MGISNFYFTKIVRDIKPRLKTNIKVLCLGYPDLLVTLDCLNTLCPELKGKIPLDEYGDKIRAWHKKVGNLDIYDPIWIFNQWGWNIDIFDAIVHRGNEILVDLNEEIDKAHHSQYDLVIDTGTLEHCFNAGTAFKNVCNCIAKDGILMTAAPLTKINHGYYNFSPILYRDGLTQNGFNIIEQSFMNSGSSINNNEIIKNKLLKNKTVNFCIAQKEVEKEWVWPIQGKYK